MQVPNLSRALRNREISSLGGASARTRTKQNVEMGQRFLPDQAKSTNSYEARLFCGQFSTDGSVFMSACQDQYLRMYKTEQLDSWKPFKEIECKQIGWSIVDTDYSPDNRFCIYSTWSRNVHLCNVFGEYELHEALDFEPRSSRFCLFSIKFSPDNREILGGSNVASGGSPCIYLYDIERKQRVLAVSGHGDDVNSVCFADNTSQLFITGSDDTLCKVWDRRLLSTGDDSSRNQNAVGILAGHAEGITHVNPKGDGRYFISNGKDQALKLWDIRKMIDVKDASKIVKPRATGFDYRWQQRGRAQPTNRGGTDVSLMTYTGHRVYETLIRSYFSPAHTTGSRYIVTGSQCGNVFIYDLLTGEVVRKLVAHNLTVRDVSWHPSRPMLLSSSWDGSVCRWEPLKRSA